MARLAVKGLRSLDKRVRLLRPFTTQDETGTPVQEWVEDAEIWAEIKPEPFPGRFAEQLAVFGLEILQERLHQVRILYRQPIDATWRLRFGTRLFEVITVGDVQADRAVMLLVCRELVRDG